MKSITKIVLYFSFVILAPLLADAATDYCKTNLCDDGKKHIGCTNKNKKFDKTCPKDAKLVKITPTLQNLLIDQHNEKRNFVAGGNVPGLEPACRMGTMKWDKELAELAELNVKQCEMKHDECHNTVSYHYSGQNIARMIFTGKPDHTSLFSKSFDMWYNEVNDVKPSIMQKFPGQYEGPRVGHFTAMMVERNIAIGCAASTYSAKGESFIFHLVTCNYGYTNMMNYAAYTTCPTPGEECETGKNPKYPNLCSTSEKYAVNEFPKI